MRPCQTLFALALLLSASSVFAEGIVDGTWKWSADVGGNQINSVLRLQSNGEKLTGSYKDENIEVDITNGEVEDGNLWFEFNSEMQGTAFTAKFSGEFFDPEIEGEIEIFVDGNEEFAFEWEPTRSTENSDVVGDWDFVYTAPDGVEYKPTLSVKEDGGKLVGNISADSGSLPVENLKLKDHELTFDYSIKLNGSDLDLHYICKPRGNKLTGVLEYSLGGNEGDFDIVATRQTLGKEMSALVGSWRCSVTGPNGEERHPILELKENGSTLAGSVTIDGNVTELSKIELKDGVVVFAFDFSHDGVDVELTWNVKAEGNKLTGAVEFSANGEQGEIDLTGIKQDD